ncbi:hypothetical protein [Azospirillum oryzae]|nr:hypothetical protein [Azospirillum oryzae]
MLTLLMIGTMFFVVHDYGVVTRSEAYNNEQIPAETRRAFQEGAVVRTGPNAYSVYITGRLWNWAPGTIHVRQGAAITFHVTSADVLHGFEVQGTPVNLTAVPGMVGTVTHTFQRAGVFFIICNEFCGLEHQAMVGRIVVDPQEAQS